MKLLALFLVLAVLAYTSAVPFPDAVYDGPAYELATIDEATTSEPDSTANVVRQRRVTCDLLSWQSKWLTVNHSACAAKCYAHLRRGGRCRDGVCICGRRG